MRGTKSKRLRKAGLKSGPAERQPLSKLKKEVEAKQKVAKGPWKKRREQEVDLANAIRKINTGTQEDSSGN